MIVVKNNNFFIGTNLRNLQPTNKETFCAFLENFEWVSSSLPSVFFYMNSSFSSVCPCNFFKRKVTKF